MKRFNLLLMISSFIVIFYSCSNANDWSVDRVIDTSVYIMNPGFQSVSQSDLKNGTFSVYVYKGGYNNKSVNVGLAVADTLLTKYNEVNGTSYSLLPAQYYSVGKNVTLDNTHYCDSISVTFNGIPSSSSGTLYVLPLIISNISSKNMSATSDDILINVNGD